MKDLETTDGHLVSPNVRRASRRRLSPALFLAPASQFRFNKTFWLCLGLWILFLLSPARLAAVGLNAELDRDTVPVGETVTLSLVFDGIDPSGQPNLPQLPPNVQAAGVSQSRSVTIVNGVAESKVTYSYTLIARQPGDIMIPAMQLVAGGKPLTTKPLKLKIVPAGTPPPEADLSKLAWLRLTVPKTEVYVGESFPIELQLYVQNAQDAQMPQLKADGFALGQSAKPQQTKTQVNNAVYNLIIFKMSASAVRTGDLNLSADLSLTLLLPDKSRRPDPFDAFGFGRNMTAHPTVLKTETQVMHVLPLPSENVPATFNGVVGNFAMTVTAGPTNLAVGDPITVKATISGNGPIEALRLPDQPGWRDFKSYAPNTKSDLADSLGLSGAKHFEQVVIPQNHEIKILPPLEFSFFDPGSRSYQTLKGPAVPLMVRATVAAVAPPTLSSNATSQNAAPAQDDIVHIKPSLGMGAASSAPLLRQGWFLALQALPLLAWLGLLITRKRKENLANNPKLRRQRETAQRVREGLTQLRQKADAQDSDGFFATLFRLLQEQLGERLDMPSSAITESVVDEKLAGRGLQPDILAGLHELFQMCNMARYAPQKSVKELNSIIPRAERVVAGLQEMKGS